MVIRRGRGIKEEGKSGCPAQAGGSSRSGRETCRPWALLERGHDTETWMQTRPLRRFRLLICMGVVHCDVPCKCLQCPVDPPIRVCLTPSSGVCRWVLGGTDTASQWAPWDGWAAAGAYVCPDLGTTGLVQAFTGFCALITWKCSLFIFKSIHIWMVNSKATLSSLLCYYTLKTRHIFIPELPVYLSLLLKSWAPEGQDTVFINSLKTMDWVLHSVCWLGTRTQLKWRNALCTQKSYNTVGQADT